MSNSGQTARTFPSARSVSQIENVATFVAASALGPQTSPLLSVQDVEVAFTTRKGLFRTGEVRALNGVSLDLARGETVALVGESGSGKTTLGRVSLRLTKPTAGRIIYDGRDITETDDSDLHWFRKRAQIVFQDPFSSLNPYMRVYDLVEEPLVIDGVWGRDERLARVERALEAVELVPVRRFGEKFPNMMSG
ncbi:MAG: peptide/nickel transport system ATP-binding protein, partial [Thermomicrobiales bacterium]|nr:peptide/nickel transport system ATP-binding protein [Thermomicrobiales bacterium]